jgi:hypothetical protein
MDNRRNSGATMEGRERKEEAKEEEDGQSAVAASAIMEFRARKTPRYSGLMLGICAN